MKKLAIVAALSVLSVSAFAQATPAAPRHDGANKARAEQLRQDIQQNRSEIKQDKQELRQMREERRERRHEGHDRREDRREGRRAGQAPQ